MYIHYGIPYYLDKIIVIMKIFKFKIPSLKSVHRIYFIYRVIQEESARLPEMIVCVILSKKVHMNMGPTLNGYGVMTA